MRRLIASPLSINQGIAKFYAGLEADDESIADAGAAAKKKKKKAEVVVAGNSEAKAAEFKLRQIGMILLCWSVVVPVVIDLMVLPRSVKVFQIMDLSLTLVASPILLFLVWNKCYRRR
jgi:hypothetical protein